MDDSAMAAVDLGLNMLSSAFVELVVGPFDMVPSFLEIYLSVLILLKRRFGFGWLLCEWLIGSKLEMALGKQMKPRGKFF